MSFIRNTSALLAGLAVAFTWSVPARAAADVAFAGLNPRQRLLFDQYAEDHGFKEPTERRAWELELDSSQRTTFAAVTCALSRTPLRDGGNALNLVGRVLQINGEIPGVDSALQFNLAISWVDGAFQDLQDAGFFFRIGRGHGNEIGLGLGGRSTGLHLLFRMDDRFLGHAHVDYRESSVLELIGLAPGEGHLKAYNSDVRQIGPELKDSVPIDNYARFVSWFGKLPGFRR